MIVYILSLRYEGYWQNGKEHGRGVLKLKNHEVYLSSHYIEVLKEVSEKVNSMDRLLLNEIQKRNIISFKNLVNSDFIKITNQMVGITS
jgi:hypothetical protein